MRQLYEKNELTFAIVWIVIYCVLQSLANPLNEKIGIDFSASAVFAPPPMPPQMSTSALTAERMPASAP